MHWVHCMYLVKFPRLFALAILKRPLGKTIQQRHESRHVLGSTIIMDEDKRAFKLNSSHFTSVLSDNVPSNCGRRYCGFSPIETVSEPGPSASSRRLYFTFCLCHPLPNPLYRTMVLIVDSTRRITHIYHLALCQLILYFCFNLAVDRVPH
jgi:hypothetical protein